MANLRRTRDRYPRHHDLRQPDELPVFDSCYPPHERFPRRVVVEFAERSLPSGRASAVLTLVSVEPNAFPEGPTRLMDLEAEKLPSWLWRRAVCQGFRAMHQLGENGGGYLVADLDGRILSYQKVLA